VENLVIWLQCPGLAQGGGCRRRLAAHTLSRGPRGPRPANRGRKASPRPGRDSAAATVEEKKPAVVPTLLTSLSVPTGMRRQNCCCAQVLS
jgi:hypothetical protein